MNGNSHLPVAHHHLGTAIFNGPTESLKLYPGGHDGCRAEIDQLHLEFFIYDDIRILDVTVNDFAMMKVCNS